MPATVDLARRAEHLRDRHRDELWNGRFVTDHDIRATRDDGGEHDCCPYGRGPWASLVVVASYDDAL